ncbi:MAG: M48 family metallopeptidase [Sphingomicrobium sp.]|nr:M48 family metallopeptidase [Sphingomonadales bacterium]
MQATFYDGVTAIRHEADVRVADDRLDLAWGVGEEDSIASDLLLRLDGPRESLRVGRSDRPGWRLIFPASAASVLGPLLPAEARYGRWVDRLGLWRAAAAFGLVAALVLFIGHVAPEWIAPHVPQRWESDLGQTLVGDFGKNRCAGGAGNQALRKLAERIAPGVTQPGERHIQFTALDFGIFNAAALPGAQIILFKGLLLETHDSDAVAGVLAHEVAHVRRRHVTQALIREFGIGSLIRLFAGGIGANTEQLVSLSYTRANEAQADADAIVMLRAAHIDPRPTARLFAKLAKQTGERDGDATGYGQFLQSHPVSLERAKKFAASFRAGNSYRAVLSRGEANDLLNICWNGRGVPPSVYAPYRLTTGTRDSRHPQEWRDSLGTVLENIG